MNDVLAIAARVGEPIVLVGHSSGAVVALEAALAAPTRFAGMVLYEPPVAPTAPLGGEALVRANAALKDGDPGRAMEIHLRDIVQVSGPMFRIVRSIPPLWRRMSLYGPGQIADDNALESLGVGLQRYGDVDIPVLLLGGGRSPKHLRVRLNALADVLPRIDSVVILKWQGHTANARAPRKVAQIVATFADKVLPKP